MCHQDISVDYTNIAGEISGPTCRRLGQDCEIVMKCKECTVDKTSTISYLLNEINSYATTINYNVTMSSSIPDEDSSIESSITAIGTKIFRGPQPTVIPIILTPSVFISDVPD